MPSDAFNIHLVSDSSGETVTNIARACLVQYEEVNISQHSWWLIRTPGQINRVIEGIRRAPGLVIFTLLDPDIRKLLENACLELELPCISALDPVMRGLRRYLDREARGDIGRQHALDAEYFRRIDAIQFTMEHDDGQSLSTVTGADVIVLGVSRTSKTPTCMYLANRGLKAANIPLVPGVDLPEAIVTAQGPLIVGLTRDPKSLADIRQNRLRIMNETRAIEYADVAAVEKEVANARRLYTRHRWPVVDVTRKSIEESAATIIQLYEKRRAERAGA